jgi:NADPH2:quinone reductase
VKAWVATSLDGEDGLQLQELPSPQCGSEQIRVANHAVALNFPDVLITRGKYQLRLEPPFVPGSESAGIITEVGDDVTEVAVGDRVLTVCGVGAFADEVVVAPSLQQVHIVPDDMPFTHAAGFGMVHGTALHGLRQRGALQPGESVLVLGSGGGCGSAAVGVAAAMGARVIAAASSPEKCSVATELGARQVINYATEDLRERVMDITNGAGVDVVFDPVGGALFDQGRRCVGWNGRYLVVGFAAGDIPVMPANYTILKSMALIGVAYGMSAIKDPAMNRANFDQLFAWYDAGQLRVHIGNVVTFGELRGACAQMYAGTAIGKTVIEIEPALGARRDGSPS